MRVVRDTSMIVAAIRSSQGASFAILDLAGEHNGLFEPVLTYSLASEYEEVIHRPEHRRDWTDTELYELIQALIVPAHWAAPNFNYRPLLNDPGDEMVLEAAIINEKHFPPATLAKFGIKTIRPGDFINMLLKNGLIYGKK
jgi:predicted nucleic acid-binding protein